MEFMNNYIFILSLIYCLKFIFDITVKLKDTEPTPIKRNNYEKALLYFGFSYIIYYIIY